MDQQASYGAHPVEVSKVLHDELCSFLYDSGLNITPSRGYCSSPTSGNVRVDFDFCVTTIPAAGNVRLFVFWVREEDILAVSQDGNRVENLVKKVKARVAMCLNLVKNSPKRLILLVTRAPEFMEEFSQLQLYAMSVECRCIPVTKDLNSVAQTLRWLQHSKPRQMKKLESNLDQRIEATCCLFPRVGEKTCKEKLLPQCKNIKGIVQHVQTPEKAAILNDLIGPATFASIKHFLETPIDPFTKTSSQT